MVETSDGLHDLFYCTCNCNVPQLGYEIIYKTCNTFDKVFTTVGLIKEMKIQRACYFTTSEVNFESRILGRFHIQANNDVKSRIKIYYMNSLLS